MFESIPLKKVLLKMKAWKLLRLLLLFFRMIQISLPLGFDLKLYRVLAAEPGLKYGELSV